MLLLAAAAGVLVAVGISLGTGRVGESGMRGVFSLAGEGDS